MILYFAADLLWATRIKATADDLGISCRPVRTSEMLDARLADSNPTALVLDLETAEAGIDLLRHLRLREAEQGGTTRIRVVAFGPHVRTDLMDAARVAGADEVLARGAFDRRLPEVLRKLGRPSPDRDPSGI